MIDTHAHLYADAFEHDCPQVIERARQNHVVKILLPNIDSSSVEPMLQLTERNPELFVPMMGLHPCSVKEEYAAQLETVEKLLQERTYCAVGEIGLDFYWDLTYKDQQIKAFHRQLEVAVQMGLPVSIHTRNAFAEAIDIVSQYASEGLRGVFHCFTGTPEEAQKAMDLGFYLGIGGVVTFKNSGLIKTLEAVDLRLTVLETDAPYLAPVPYRGKRNESSYIRLVAERVAEVKRLPLEEVAAITTANARELFNLK
ncbi:MAG: TatD family hydrolase [Chitinophagales bacterium]|nr:MAG: TatD family hydrolase [Chitinophagales bacterium]